MITKFVLIVWIGVLNSQTMSVVTFESEAECKAVATVLKTKINYSGWYRCTPYSFSPEANK
jgi:hypothetical protein